MYFNFYNDDYLFYYYFTLPPSCGWGGLPSSASGDGSMHFEVNELWVTTGQIPYNPKLHVYVYPMMGIASRVTTERIPYNPELYYLVLYPIAGKAY